MAILFIVIWVIIAVILNMLYHKLFHVVYFGFNAVIKEWGICFLLAMLVVAFILEPFVKKDDSTSGNSNHINVNGNIMTEDIDITNEEVIQDFIDYFEEQDNLKENHFSVSDNDLESNGIEKNENINSYVTLYVVNCNEDITLRTSPSTEADAIRRIPLGEPVSFIEKAANGFYMISYMGDVGYALASYLTTGDGSSLEEGYPMLKVVNCNESITLRMEPSTSAEEIRQIPLGATVSYIETAENGFYKVTYLGDTGYALASYLEFI